MFKYLHFIVVCSGLFILWAWVGSSTAAPAPVPDGLTAADWSQIQPLLPQPHLESKLVNDDVLSDNYFGMSVSLSGDTLAISAPSVTQGDELGMVYIFVRSGDTWLLQAQLQANDSLPTDGFGYVIDLEGDTLLVGAPYAGGGSVYVFVRSGIVWNQQAKLMGNDTVVGDYFGMAVALAGDTALIGAGYAAEDTGSAYVFVRSGLTWSQQTKFTASDAEPNSYFGMAVALEGDLALVGALYANNGTGSVYVFIRSGTVWSEQTQLIASDATFSNHFGSAIALDNDTAVIGSPEADKAYVFTRSGLEWSEEAILTASNGAVNNYFGNSITLEGDTAVVSAAHASDYYGGVTYIFTRTATTWVEQNRLEPSDLREIDFGLSLTLEGNTLIIGAPVDIDGGTEHGYAYQVAYENNNWSQQAKLAANNTTTNYQFGHSVDVDQNSAIVGVPGYTNGGLAYIFTRPSYRWYQQTPLTAADIPEDGQFGYAVALQGDTAVVSAVSDDENGLNSGSVYIFVREGTDWSQQAKLTAADGQPFDYFGQSVALDGDTLLVGMYNSGNNIRSAYVFIRSGTTWSQQAKLTLPITIPAEPPALTQQVALAGDTAVLTAHNDAEHGAGSGAVYVFVRSGTTWGQQAKLTAASAAAGDRFGTAVAVDSDTIVVGAIGYSGLGENSGSAYVFVRSGETWHQQAHLTASDGAAQEQFGAAVAIDGDVVAVGARAALHNGVNSGSVYLFARSGSTWQEETQAIPNDLNEGDAFYLVALEGNTLIVGAPLQNDGGGMGSGSAYVFNLNAQTVTIVKQGGGEGLVYSTPEGIHCGSQCEIKYPFGQVITLTASPQLGSTFAGWDGSCSGTGHCMVTMNQTHTVTATFALLQRTLTVTKIGTGSGLVTSTPAGIHCGSDCTESFVHGTVVTLTATAETGSTFAGWSGACSGTDSCVVTMAEAQTVTATFNLVESFLIITKEGTGLGLVTSTPAGIHCGSDCTESFTHGTVVTLTATAETGSTFAGWSGACSGTDSCVVTMAEAQTVTATFNLVESFLTITKEGTGLGLVSSTPAGIHCGSDCTESFVHGTVVTLTATAETGSTFAGWSGACSGTDSCVVTMAEAQTVTATFNLVESFLTITKEGTGLGLVSSTPAGIHCGSDCTESFVHGTVVTLTATAETGSTFAGWSGACSGTDSCVVTMAEAQTVTATFNLVESFLTITKEGTGLGLVTSTPAGIHCGSDCTESFVYGTVVTLTATAETGSAFAGWSGACSGTDSCVVTMAQTQTVTATFVLLPPSLHTVFLPLLLVPEGP